MFVLGYNWLSLATIDLVGDNREFEVKSNILSILYPLLVVDMS